MRIRTALMVLAASLMVTTVWAQAVTEPAGVGPRPAMIVEGRALTPAAWVDGIDGETVTVNGVSMMWVGAAAKDAGGTATITRGPDQKLLQVRVGLRTMEYIVLPPGEFWRHPWVRHLIANAGIHRLQPMPYWPYEEANIPARPPHTVNWKRPYLEWRPDESWLLLNLMPPEPVEPEVPLLRPRVDEEVTVEDAARAVPPAEPAAPAPGPPPGEMGGPPPDAMGGPPMDPMMDEPPPM